MEGCDKMTIAFVGLDEEKTIDGEVRDEPDNLLTFSVLDEGEVPNRNETDSPQPGIIVEHISSGIILTLT